MTAVFICRHPGLKFQQREARFDALIEDANRILDRAIATADQPVSAIVCMFSGGNDSTVLAHLMRSRVTHFGMANTGIGIEETRQYVRDTCATWGVPLIEKHPPPGKGYRELVLGQVRPGPRGKLHEFVWGGGFPGPAQHGLFFQRLKERCFDQIRNEVVGNPRKNRVLFLAGRRAEESKRRTSRFLSGQIREIEPRRGSVIWVSPLINWTKLDLNAYRMRFPDVPRNEVADLLHMSGECLCGCFGHEGELEEIRMWYPHVAKEINDLEQEVREANLTGDNGQPAKCQWNWKGQGTCNSGMCNN